MTQPIRPRPASDVGTVGSALVGVVTRLSPMHVTVGGREYGPLVATRAAAVGLTVGGSVVLVRQENDPDRLIVIDGVA